MCECLRYHVRGFRLNFHSLNYKRQLRRLTAYFSDERQPTHYSRSHINHSQLCTQAIQDSCKLHAHYPPAVRSQTFEQFLANTYAP